MRNMEKTAEKADHNIPDYYDLYGTELTTLFRKARSGNADETYEALVTAFKYGFVLGHRATLACKVKKRL